jgi:copper/silver efflux system protein
MVIKMQNNNQQEQNLSHDPTKSFIARVIEWSVNNQLLIGILMISLLVIGGMAIKNTSLDAIPDMSDTQVIIRTEFAGQSPQIIEDLVTYPLSTAMLGLPRIKNVRGFSMFGSSFVYIIFEDKVDQYWARSRVIEALSKIQGDLPNNVVPQIGPDASGVGWVYQYALIDKSGQYDLSELRSLQDWFLKFELATVPGVSEVASVGGFVKEYQILIDPNHLRAFNVPLKTLMKSIQNSSMDVGGRVIEKSEMEFMIRSKGYITNIDQLKNISIYSHNNIPVKLSDIARIIEGPELRRGVTELNGEGEVVSGVIVMRSGENALNVIERVKEKIKELKHSLPAGVEIVSVYDRGPLIEGAVEYLKEKLIEEGIVVALISFLFLLHARSAFVSIVTLPLGVLAAFIVMSAQGITANIMSLSGIAIAIGAMVDASVVMVENAHRKLSDLPKTASTQEKNAAILLSAKEVGPGLFFSLLIITVSFIPVFSLTGESYRLFSPLAFTKTYAMAFAAILSVTIVPVLMLWLIKGKIRKEEENPLNRWFIKIYRPILNKALNKKHFTIAIAVVILGSMAWPMTKTGSEFMPALYEGKLLYMPSTMPGVSITKAKEILQQTNRMIKEIPEIDDVFGKVGRTDSATDSAPISMIETWISLKPKNEWRKDIDIDGLIKELDKKVKLPGVINSWGYPIKTRMDMVSTGVRTPIGIKITGDNLETIGRVALNVEAIMKTVAHTRSAFADRVTGGKYIEIEANRSKLARLNIDMESFQNIVKTSLGGMKLAESIQGRERYNIMLRYDRQFHEDPEDIENLLIQAPTGQYIPLVELADIKFTEGPPMIKSENARLTGWVFVDIEGIDMGTYVKSAQEIIAEKVSLPPGYALIWSGQFEQMLEAKGRMQIAVPAVIFVIFTLLMIHFGRLDRTLIIMLSLPFGLIGGVWALYLAGYNFSVAVGVGFIALAGIAVETAVVMLLYMDHQVRTVKPQTKQDLLNAIIHGAVLRVRPKLMTVCIILAGLMPIFITEGLGSDVMRRIALPMVGGMISTTALTLIVIPVIYYLWEERKLKA